MRHRTDRRVVALVTGTVLAVTGLVTGTPTGAATAARRAATTVSAATPAPPALTVTPASRSGTPLIADTFAEGTVGSWYAASAGVTLSLARTGAFAAEGSSLQATGLRRGRAGLKRRVDTSALVAGRWYMVSAAVRPQGGAPTHVALAVEPSLPGTVTTRARIIDDWTSTQTTFQWQGTGTLVIALTFPPGCPGDAVPTSVLIDDVRLAELAGPTPQPLPAVAPACGPRPGRSTAAPRTSTSPSPSPSLRRRAAPAIPSPLPAPATGDTWGYTPSIVRRPDGTYLRATSGKGIALAVSPDRVAWRTVGPAFSAGTPWATWDAEYQEAREGNGTASPSLTYANGLYWLYYEQTLCLYCGTTWVSVSTSPTGEPGSWTHRGVVDTSATRMYDAGDPDLLTAADGRWWLVFSRHWDGLFMIEIDPATGLRRGSSMTPVGRGSYSLGDAPYHLVSPHVLAHDGRYYLFASVADCCTGNETAWSVIVGRSSSPQGPYLDRFGTPLTDDGGGTTVLRGGGYSSVLHDDGDHLVYVHDFNRIGMNRLVWDAQGWPSLS